MLTAAPIYVSWNYTYACNFNCTHCYSRAGSYPRELDTAAYFRIVDQFADNHVLKVGLGGGEPFIRRDCVSVLEMMADHRIDTNVTTNGWFLTPHLCSQLVQARLGTLYVSLDSATADVHDGFRRKTGSFDRVVGGIRNAVAAGLRVKLSTVITSLNAHELADIAALAEDLGAIGVEFKRFRPTGNGEAVADALSLPEPGEVTIRHTVAALSASSAMDVALFYDPETTGGIGQGCPCGVRSLTLRPNGDVSPCAYAAAVIGNLEHGNLGELWLESPALQAIRCGGSCSGLERGPSPSGPGVAAAPRRKAAACSR